MFKVDAEEATPICVAVVKAALERVPLDIDLRYAVNDFVLNATALLLADAAGEPLQEIFQLAQAAGITVPQMEAVRQVATGQTAVTAGAILVMDSLVQYALATEGAIIAATTFTNRDDVEALRLVINDAFAPSEEKAADAMDSTTYQQLVSLHAMISYFLTTTAQPLPRMLDFEFAAPLPTLVAAYKLYADASRADELRDQNRVVHPLFMPPIGRALSA